jgi:23S rRNA-/tRNA-specific pseudouridylate synthase
MQHTAGCNEAGKRLKDVAPLVFSSIVCTLSLAPEHHVSIDKTWSPFTAYAGTSSQAKRFIKAGTIRVNSEQVERSYIVKDHDILSLHATRSVDTSSRDGDGPAKAQEAARKHVATMQRGGFRVLHEDANMAVVFKPPGI